MSLRQIRIRWLAASVILCSVSGVSRPASGQGWVQPDGGLYLKAGVHMMRANAYFERGGNEIDIPTLSDYVFNLYGEFGLTDRITVIAYLPVVERITLARQVGSDTGFEFFPGDASTRPADVEVGARYGIVRSGPAVLSTGFTLGLPTGDDDQQYGLVTGDGEFNQTVYLGAGYSFWPLPFYVTGSTGYNVRYRGFSDEFLYRAEVGATWRGRVTTLIRAHGLVSMHNGDSSFAGGTAGLNANDQEFFVLGGEIGLGLGGGFGIATGVEQALSGERTLSAARWNIGLYHVRR